jgi:hypothetical protein
MTNPLTDPRVTAALAQLTAAGIALATAVEADAPAGGDLADGITGIVLGSVALGNCAAEAAGG